MTSVLVPSEMIRGMMRNDEQDAEFIRFFRIVQDAAASRGCVFFLWSPECHDGLVGDIWCEDLSGWLVPKEHSDAFEVLWAKHDDAIWNDEYDGWQAFARWSESDDGVVIISFEFPLF